MIHAAAAVQGKGKGWRIVERSQYVPGGSDQQHDGQAAEGVKALPGGHGKELAGDQKVQNRCPQGEDQGDQAFEQQSGAETCGHRVGPGPGMRFFLIQHPQEGPHRERDGEGQHHVGYQDAGKEKKADASCHAQAGVEAGHFAEGPFTERCR